jgi:predicted dehydrogenase
VPVAWGVLSTARIAARLIEAARRTESAEIVAVGSRDAASARAFAEGHGISRAHDSYDALLADPAVEAVYIPLPNGMHVDWAVRALQAGKHVLCEKPLGRDPGEVARAFDAADRAGLVLSEAFMWRHHPQVARLRELLDEGAIGAPRLVRACFSFVLTRGEDPRLDPALGGGALMDVGCYCVGGARFVAGGDPLTVAAQTVVGPTGVDLRLGGVLRFDGDLLATIDCGFDAYGRGELEVIGSDGRIVLTDPWHGFEARIVLERGYRREVIELDGVDSFVLELEDVSAAIRGERPALLGRADALGQARTIDALHRSAAQQRLVSLAG